MAGAPQFEFPTQMRELAERNVEQVRAGMRQVQERTMRFTQQNMDASFALASELAKAKDLKEMMDIQSRHAQLQMAAYTMQAQELGRLVADAAQNGQIKG